MAKYYVGENSDYPLTVTTTPGQVTEELIIGNLKRMILLDAYEEEIELTQEDAFRTAASLYYDNLDKMNRLAPLRDNLIPLEWPEEEQNLEIWWMGLDNWWMWHFEDPSQEE